MDRIDLRISVPRLTSEELLSLAGTSEPSASIRQRVIRARKIQQERWAPWGLVCNAELPEKLVQRHLSLPEAERTYLQDMAGRLKLSGRGLSRVLKVSRTIADLAGEPDIRMPHLAEALMYRQN